MRVDTAPTPALWRQYPSSFAGSVVLHILLIILVVYLTPKVIENKWERGKVMFEPVKPKEEQAQKKPQKIIPKAEVQPIKEEPQKQITVPDLDLRPAMRDPKSLPDNPLGSADFARSSQDQIRTVDLSQIPIARSGGDMSNAFAVPDKPGAQRSDKSNLSFKDALPGLANKEGRSPSQAYDPNAPLGGTGSGPPGGGKRRGGDGVGGGIGADVNLGGTAKKKEPEKAASVGAFDASKWERLTSTGPVAGLQPYCLNKTGRIQVGNFLLQCADNQIIAAWKRRE